MYLHIKKWIIGLAATMAVLFTSAQQANAQSNYIIRPGDTLQVEVLEDSSLNRATLVLPDGTISFPLAGTLPAEGRSVEKLRQDLTAALSPNFATPPNVFVSVVSLAEVSAAADRSMDVYALGEFEAPGRKEVKPGTTLLQFLAEAGGLSKFAADKRIELLRTDPKTGQVTTYRFNYRAPSGGTTGINGGTRLAPGDVVRAPQRRLFE